MTNKSKKTARIHVLRKHVTKHGGNLTKVQDYRGIKFIVGTRKFITGTPNVLPGYEYELPGHFRDTFLLMHAGMYLFIIIIIFRVFNSSFLSVL